MLKDILQIITLALTSLTHALHIAYMKGFQTRLSEFIQSQTDALPEQLTTQKAAFDTAYAKEDQVYRQGTASQITEQLTAADDQQDNLFRQIRRVISAYVGADYDPDRQQAAKNLQFCLNKYNIDLDEAYEAESANLLQWLDEIMSADSTLSKDVQTLGIVKPVGQLMQAAMLVQQLIRQRNEERSAKELDAINKARAVTDEEYRLLVQVLNACALLDSTEKRYATLISYLNADIHYYKTVVLARRKTDAAPDQKDNPDPDNKKDDEGGSTDNNSNKQ